jgi:transcriptional regulator with XRE-family HTH domain
VSDPFADEVQEVPFGQELARLRRRRGLSQQRLAEMLCAVAGVTTVSRHEVSRWERGERLPARAWLGWLTLVLGGPLPDPVRGITPGEARRWRFLYAQLRAGAARTRAGKDGLASKA